MNLVVIGMNIKRLRVNKKITQEELADLLYVSKQAVSKWEKGINLPDIERMEKICKLFNIKIDELLSEDLSTNSWLYIMTFWYILEL